MIRSLLLTASLAALPLFAATDAAMAGPISTACLASERPQANAGLCGCIQAAADRTLSRADQRQAAKFFRDPHQAQEIRQSAKKRHEEFWLRYRDFSSLAEASCSPA